MVFLLFFIKVGELPVVFVYVILLPASVYYFIGKLIMIKTSKRNLLNFLFILLTLAIVIWIAAGNTEIEDMGAALTQASPLWLVFALFIFILAVFFDCLCLYTFFKKQKHPVALKYCFYISLMGQYYDNVTPGASGGQPFQVYFLKKKNVPIGVSSSALAVKFFCYQFTYVLLTLVFLIVKKDLIFAQYAGGTIWLLILGLVIHSFSVVLLLLLAINTHWVRWLVVSCIHLLHKMRLCKAPDKWIAKSEGVLSSFSSSVNLMRKRPRELLVQLFLCVCQVTLINCVIIFIYKAFGLSACSYIDLFVLSVLLYISTSHAPLPGAAGAQEGGFIYFFRGIFPSNIIYLAVLIWRFITFYFLTFAGAIITVVHSTWSMRKKKNQPPDQTNDPADPISQGDDESHDPS